MGTFRISGGPEEISPAASLDVFLLLNILSTNLFCFVGDRDDDAAEAAALAYLWSSDGNFSNLFENLDVKPRVLLSGFAVGVAKGFS